ncbi:MAG: iron-containing alcohol dehydrogenase, partial [Acidobacteria bacterium]|nr:iron-containing alcohol dehydrogenase [Acidobacteriota bacterium]
MRVAFGAGRLAELGELAAEIGGRRALLVTDPGLVAAGHAASACAALRIAGLEVELFDAVSPNPTTREVEAGTEIAAERSIDLIVALGGGSAMDCAKGINFLLTNGGRMEDYWGFGKATKRMLPSIGVPTTAGTGSDAQSYALISQAETHRKLAGGDPTARDRVVILDPALLATIPRRVAAATGRDALS